MLRHLSIGALLAIACLPWAGCSQPVQGSVGDPDEISFRSRDLGFNSAFEAELAAVGQISPQEFHERFAPPDYLDKLSWDPAAAKFWGRLMQDPQAPPAFHAADALPSHPPEQLAKLRGPGLPNPYDFRLNDEEAALFRRNGFVVSPRMGSHSFTDLYHRIYVHDLPVFVTADSMLHAWHRQFDRLVEGLETEEIQPALARLMASMARELPAAEAEYGSGVLYNSLNDVDFFLCVARRLLAPESNAETAFKQESRVRAAMQACDGLTTHHFPLFGRQRLVDFSQFKPRGRYDQSEWTKQYFRAVMWLGRIDFRLAGTKDIKQELRELGAVVVLHDLLRRSGEMDQWKEVDRLLQFVVGQSDCLNFTQLDELLRAHNDGPAAKMSDRTLARIHERVQAGRLYKQQIRGDHFCIDPADPNKLVLPTSFAFLGQRFVLDSWALSKVVYDDISWDQEKVHRRIPSALDVGFAVFANNHVTPRLHERLTTTAGKRFRDGLPYQHNLAAVRNTIDALPASTWQASVYARWLRCLRELSTPTTDDKFPEAMRTEAWAQKTTATQLASWTQLRHDTVLYAKPSYSTGNACFYPAGFVEPIPRFWRRFNQMVQQTLTFFDESKLYLRGDRGAYGQERARKRRLESLKRFADATTMLRSIAEKQRAQEELTAEQTKFLQEIVVRNNLCGAPPIGGWYPQLFPSRSDRPDQDDAHKWTALVADVHTDPPDLDVSGDPGCVLHEAVGNVELLVVAVDSGDDRVIYLGPVFSHYEFETPPDVRLTNGEWQARLRENRVPRPDWAASYSAPGDNPDAAKYGLDPNRP